jgi:transposase, IS6 family
LSYRDVEELLAERGLHADHVTVWRWVQRYAPEMERRLRSRLRPTNDSWRVDETYIRVRGRWVNLYRAVDSTGVTVDFLLSAKRDAAAAERFLAKALGGENHPAPRVINTDEHAGYPSAIVRLKAEEALKENCRHRPVQYLNNVLEQDHRAIKRRVRVSQHFRSFWELGARSPAMKRLEQWRDQELRRRNLPDHVFEHLLTMARLHAANRYDRLIHDVEAITGMPATSTRDFVARNAELFRPNEMPHEGFGAT